MKKNKKGVFAAVRSAAATHKLLSTGTLLCTAASVLASLLPPLLLGQVIDSLTGGVALTFGAVLAASPVARAAVSRWFVQITELVTAYRITPADAGGTVQDYTPTAPLGYVLSGDFTGRENGIRVMRWTSSQGDLLFEAVPMTGDEPISVELRSNSTGGLSSTETGQRPTGGAGEPEDYETENVTVHGLSARLYRILPAKGASPQVQHGCGLWFYRGSDPVHFHQVSIPEGAAALVWVDEQANCFFLLIGGQSRQELVSTAESMYESERS